jgi:hypothetical protein
MVPPKLKIWLKTSVAHGHKVRHRLFFRFLQQKNLTLPYLFTLFEFWESKNCLVGQALVNSDVQFPPDHFDILCIFSSSYATRNPFLWFCNSILQKNRNSCLLIFIDTRWHNTWAPRSILFFEIYIYFFYILQRSKRRSTGRGGGGVAWRKKRFFMWRMGQVRHKKTTFCGTCVCGAPQKVLFLWRIQAGAHWMS